jgi:protein-S-isoprenylcysteine O-methyltransferase Ste14
MLQGAVVAVLLAAVVAGLEYAGLGDPEAAGGAGVLLLVGALLVAVFFATTRLRRWPRPRRRSPLGRESGATRAHR